MSFQPSDPELIEDPNVALAEADAGYTEPDIETDERELRDRVYERLRARAPGWEPHDGNQECWLTEAYAAEAAELRALARSVPGDAVFTTYGEEVLGIPARIPTPALGFATYTATDDEGYTIPPGQQLTLKRTGDQFVAFEVVTGAVIEPGETVAYRVEIRALEPGAGGNGLYGPGELAEGLDWVHSIDVPTHTYGGDDGQDETQYVNQLTQLMRVIALRPVLPGDYATLALARAVGIGRAVAMDGYDPATKTWEHARTITLLLADDWGDPCSPELKEQVKEIFEALREVNVIINVIDADYETVDVTFQVTAFAEQNPETVEEICTETITEYLSPAKFRLGVTSPSIAAGEVIPPPRPGAGERQIVIRRHDLIGLLDRCRGVAWVDEVWIDGDTEDRTLAGATVLPKPGTITGQVESQ